VNPLKLAPRLNTNLRLANDQQQLLVPKNYDKRNLTYTPITCINSDITYKYMGVLLNMDLSWKKQHLGK
jgi:hypothetical protein